MSDAIRKWKARPTVYRGVRMRSRTEARVAEVLDRIGMDWSYEGDCFAGRGGQYLPDFVVGEIGDTPLIIEVKPLREMVGDAFDKMAVVWETDETACLVVITTDTPYQHALELVDGEARASCFGIVDCSCGTASLVYASAAGDEGGLTCPSCDKVPPDDGIVFGDEDDTLKGFVASLAGFGLLTNVELGLREGPVSDRMGL